MAFALGQCIRNRPPWHLILRLATAWQRVLQGKSPEEIRSTFNLPDDLTEEEKLEPLKNVDDDPRLRLLNTFYARKRKASTCLTQKQ